MKEVRLTFASEGFEAVSKVLVEMGLSFRVEPVGPAARQAAAEAAPAAKPRAPAGPARKTSKAKRAARPAKAPAAGDTTGAERLRAAIAQSGTAYRSPLEPSTAEVASPGSAIPDEHRGD